MVDIKGPPPCRSRAVHPNKKELRQKCQEASFLLFSLCTYTIVFLWTKEGKNCCPLSEQSTPKPKMVTQKCTVAAMEGN